MVLGEAHDQVILLLLHRLPTCSFAVLGLSEKFALSCLVVAEFGVLPPVRLCNSVLVRARIVDRADGRCDFLRVRVRSCDHDHFLFRWVLCFLLTADQVVFLKTANSDPAWHDGLVTAHSCEHVAVSVLFLDRLRWWLACHLDKRVTRHGPRLLQGLLLWLKLLLLVLLTAVDTTCATPCRAYQVGDFVLHIAQYAASSTFLTFI